MNPNEINILPTNNTPATTDETAKYENITPADFLIGATGIVFLLLAVYLTLIVIYPTLVPMPQYVSLQGMKLVDYKRELLRQAMILSIFGTAFLSGLHGIRKVCLNRNDRS